MSGNALTITPNNQNWDCSQSGAAPIASCIMHREETVNHHETVESADKFENLSVANWRINPIGEFETVGMVMNGLMTTARSAIAPISTEFMGGRIDFKPIPESPNFVPPIALELDLEQK